MNAEQTDMGKVLFAHDGPLLVDERGQCYGVGFDNRLRERYLQLGNHVTFLMRGKSIPEHDAGKYEKIDANHFRFIQVPNVKTPSALIRHGPKARAIIERAVAEADILIARLPSVIGSWAVEYARKHGKSYMVEAVACTWDALWNYSWLGKVRAPYAFVKTRQLIKTAPFTVYVTNEFLQRRYPTRGTSIGISNVHLKSFEEEALSRRLQRISRYDGSRPLVLGTLANVSVRYKGQQYVIEALKRLQGQGLHYEYRIAGSGDDTYLRQTARLHRVESQVRIDGPIPHHRVFEWLDNIDIYIQPSKQEGLPRAVIEAMSRGCPVVGSRTGGIPELIESEYIFEKGDVSGMVAILSSMSTSHLEAIAQRNFEVARSYVGEVLDDRRRVFYEKFLDKIRDGVS